MLHWAAWAVWRWSDEDRGVRRWRIVGVQEDGRVAFGEPGLKADDPCEAAGLGNEERDEDDVFHIGVMVIICWIRSSLQRLRWHMHRKRSALIRGGCGRSIFEDRMRLESMSYGLPRYRCCGLHGEIVGQTVSKVL